MKRFQVCRIAIQLLFIIYCFNSNAFAQINRLSPGDTVRVTSSTYFFQSGIGEFVTISGDTLVIEMSSREISIPFKQIEKLEIGMYENNTSKGAIIGGLIGVITMTLAIAVTPEKKDDFNVISKGKLMAVLSPISGLVGAGIGAIIGSGIRSKSWTEVPISSYSFQGDTSKAEN